MEDLAKVGNPVPVRNDEETKVIEEEEKQPHKYPNPRFQLFSAFISCEGYRKHVNAKQFLLYGFIAATDLSVSREDGWVPTNEPSYRYAMLFDRRWYDPLSITYNSHLKPLNNPSFSLSTFLEIVVELFVINEEADDFYQVGDGCMIMNLLEHDKPVDSFINEIFNGYHGSTKLSFIVLTDAVDAALEITFQTQPDYDVCGKLFSVHILAYYGGDIGFCYTSNGKRYNKVTLLYEDSVSVLENRKLPLNTSLLAVPAKGSLIIEAYFSDPSRKVNIRDSFEFPTKLRDSSIGCIESTDCSSSLELKVDWKYKAT